MISKWKTVKSSRIRIPFILFIEIKNYAIKEERDSERASKKYFNFPVVFSPYIIFNLLVKSTKTETVWSANEMERRKEGEDHTLKCWHHYYLLPLIFIRPFESNKIFWKRNFIPSVVVHLAANVCAFHSTHRTILIYCNLFIWLWALQSFQKLKSTRG